MSEDRSIADSILMGKVIDKNVETAEREVKGLPFNHPARMQHGLDEEIVREASGFGVNHDIVKALGITRKLQADEVEGSRSWTKADAGRQVRDDLDTAIKDAVDDYSPFRSR
jgi:hypothetical protein